MDKTKTIAALFDFDGVVMDTESQYTIYWNGVGRKYHPSDCLSKDRPCRRYTTVFSRVWMRNRLK